VCSVLLLRPFKLFTALIVIRDKHRGNYRQGSNDKPKTSHTMSSAHIHMVSDSCQSNCDFHLCVPISPCGFADRRDFIKIAKYEIIYDNRKVTD